MLFDLLFKKTKPTEAELTAGSGHGCGSGSCGCKKTEVPPPEPDGYEMKLGKKMDRRAAFRQLTAGLLAGAGLAQSCSITAGDEKREEGTLKWEEYFKKNYRLMSDEERGKTVERLERLYEINTGKTINVSTNGVVENVLYGYAFNISKCQGYMDCVNACV